MTRNQSCALVAAGLILMLIGAVDPLEGSIAVLGGGILVAAGASGSEARRRYRLTVAALLLITVGVSAMVTLSAWGGVGGHTGRSTWWLLLCLPYPVGWVLALIVAVRRFRELRQPV